MHLCMCLTCLHATMQWGHPSLLPCVHSTSCAIPLTSTSLLLAFSFLFICLLTALALDYHPVAPLHHCTITLLPHCTIALVPLDPSPALSPPTLFDPCASPPASSCWPIYGPTRYACLCHFTCSHPRLRHHPSLLIATNAVGMQVVSGVSL